MKCLKYSVHNRILKFHVKKNSKGRLGWFAWKRFEFYGKKLHGLVLCGGPELGGEVVFGLFRNEKM